MFIKRFSHLFKAILLLLSTALFINSANAMPYDLDNGNATLEVIIPRVIPAVFQTLSPSGGDAPLVLRATTLFTTILATKFRSIAILPRLLHSLVGSLFIVLEIRLAITA